MAAAFEPANDSGIPLIDPYIVTYVSPALYEVAKRADIITWTYPIVLAVAVWDWLVSLPSEYDRIWKREISVITFFYLGSRYYALAVLSWLLWMYVPEVHSWDYCQKWFRWSCGLTVGIEIFAGGILLIRTWAFTGRKLYYLIIFTALYFTMIVYMLVVTDKALELVPWLIQGQTRGKCVTAGLSTNQLATGFWVAPMAYTILLTGVTLVESVKIRSRMPASKRSPLFRVFIRDGVMYLVVITVTNTANVAFFAQDDTSLKGSAMAFQFLLASLMSCRLVLSLRDSESFAMSSAAASLATKSFWKTGNAGGTTSDGSKTFIGSGGRPDIVKDDEEYGKSVENIAMGHAHGGHHDDGSGVPTTYIDPMSVQVTTDKYTVTSEKSSVKEDPALRF